MIWHQARNAYQHMISGKAKGSTSAPTQLPPIDAYADIHCHCLPGIDDGPADLDTAIRLCKALVEDGAKTVVATPHQLGVYDLQNTADTIRQIVKTLRAALAEEGVALEVLPGADVRVDERIGTLLDVDQVLTVADRGKYMLLELPHNVSFDPGRVLGALQERRICPILTHPERHPEFHNSVEATDRWLNDGAIMQITAGSLVGDFGSRAYRTAWEMIKQCRVAVIASDSHDPKRRPPRMTAAYHQIAEQFSTSIAKQLCVTNPDRILKGQPVRPAIV